MRQFIAVILVLAVALGIAGHGTAQDTYHHPNPAVERWHSPALNAGWSQNDWRTLSCVIARESHGIPYVINRADPGYGSWGLTQINMSKGFYGTWRLYRAILGYNMYALLEGHRNLRIAKDLSGRAGRMFGDRWKPWRPLGRCA